MKKPGRRAIISGFLLLPALVFPQEKEHVLVVVEKVAGSVGFYSEQGSHLLSLPVGEFPHEMIFTPDRKRAYITNNGSLRYTDEVQGGNTVSVVNLEKMKLEKPLDLGRYHRPHAICYDEVSGLLAVGVENPDRLLILDPVKGEILADYDNQGKTPHMVTLSPGAEYAYISNVQSGNVAILNLKTNTVKVVPVGYKPQQSVLSADGRYLYVACDDYIAVIDVRNKMLAGTIGRGANRLQLVKNDSLLVYASTKRGFGFADPHTWKVIFHLDIPYKPFSLRVSSDSRYLYLAAEEQNLIYVASLDKMKIVNQIKVPWGTNPDVVMDLWVEKNSLPAPAAGSSFPEFKRIVIDPDLKKGYQVKTADLNGDLKMDIIALSDRLPEVYWYENPTWEKHLVTSQSTRNIDLAPYDIDGDGDVDLALATRFDLSKSREGGYVYWLENPGNSAGEWRARLIDSIPTSHRIRWADMDGDGRKELILVPLVGYGAEAPAYREPATIQGYFIPQGPRWQPWEEIRIDQRLRMIHGIEVVRWDDDIREDFLTASFEGLTLFRSCCEPDRCKWEIINLAAGQQADPVIHGAGEVSRGFLNHTEPFLAAIEPWHGNEVVVYMPAEEGTGPWKRRVIDDSFDDGHAVQCADLDFDGNDEVIAGQRGSPFNLFIYRFVPEDHSWRRIPLDMGGMSAAGLEVFDYNDDGFPDVVACGSATGNVVLYENLKAPLPGHE